MKIIITGNPNYEGLCKGLYEAYNGNQLEFIGRHNGWDMQDLDAVADYIKDYDVFVNSLLIPDNGQEKLLHKVYKTFKGSHIINISSTTSYWGDGYSPKGYLESKTALDNASKTYSQYCAFGDSKIRVSNIAFGQLDSKKINDNSNSKKISLLDAGKLVKWLIDSPRNTNIHYLAVDPIQTTL